MKNFVDMTYDEYVNYLLEKYGPAKYDYFCTETCRSKNPKSSRTKEGLFCHHIDENKMILLSTPEIARQCPFEYQKADRLVYADYIEHLLLHIKIAMEDTSGMLLGIGGIIMISGTLNGYYRHKKATGWKETAMNVIKDRYDEYIEIMTMWKKHIESNPSLSKLLPPPSLALGWYDALNLQVCKDVYGKIILPKNISTQIVLQNIENTTQYKRSLK